MDISVLKLEFKLLNIHVTGEKSGGTHIQSMSLYFQYKKNRISFKDNIEQQINSPTHQALRSLSLSVRDSNLCYNDDIGLVTELTRTSERNNF